MINQNFSASWLRIARDRLRVVGIVGEAVV